MTAPTRCAIYARVSLAKEELENQLHALRIYAAMQGWQVVAELAEQRHGNRPGEAAYNELQSLVAHRKIDVVLVWALDRLSRPDTGDLGALLTTLSQWRARGVEWYSLSEPFLSTSGAQGAVAELLVAILGWVAGWNRRMGAARTKAGLAQRKALGVRLGRPPKTGGWECSHCGSRHATRRERDECHSSGVRSENEGSKGRTSSSENQ